MSTNMKFFTAGMSFLFFGWFTLLVADLPYMAMTIWGAFSFLLGTQMDGMINWTIEHDKRKAKKKAEKEAEGARLDPLPSISTKMDFLPGWLLGLILGLAGLLLAVLLDYS